MPIEDFIINVYLMVEENYQKIVKGSLRKGRFAPKLTDSELICMEIIGEFLSFDEDKKIWEYFKNHWLEWFPKLGSYPNFAKQCANLWHVKQLIHEQLSKNYEDNIHFIDVFTLSVCKYARTNKHKSFKVEASFSYCPSKKEKYYGFMSKLLIW